MANFSDNKNRKIFSLLGIIALCISFVAIISSFTISWLTDESTTSNGEPNITYVGELDLTCTTNFKFSNLALAPDTIYTTDQNGQDIATYIKTSDIHDIDGAYVRVKFETYRKSSDSNTSVNNLDLLDLYFDGNLTQVSEYNEATKNRWYYNADDGYYYFIGGIYSADVKFNAGYKTSNTMTNLVADDDVTIEFTIECIQRQYGASESVWLLAPQIFADMAVVESQNKSLPSKITADVTIDGLNKNLTLKTGQKLSDALAQAGIKDITDSNSCGWFADEECTIPISKDTIVTADMQLHTKSATLDKLNITTDSSGKKTVTKIDSNITGEVVIPNNVEIIGAQAFRDSKITGLVIPTSVKTISSLAISGSNLESLHIPKSVTSINKYVGSPATLVSITVDPDNPVYTDGNSNCIIDKNTKTLTLGCKTTNIPNDENLVTTISEYAFRYNGAISSLHIPANIASIGLGFLTYSATDITVDIKNSIFHAKNNCLIKTATKELYYAKDPSTIPADGSVTSIMYTSLFSHTRYSLFINKYISKVVGNATSHSLIQSISVDSENPTFRAENGYLIEKSTNSLVMSSRSPGQIPNGITNIKSHCFHDYGGLTGNLILPSTLTKIENEAFSSVGSSGTINIYIPSTVTTILTSVFIDSSKVTIYTDVARASAHPSGWSTNMIGAGANVTINYGYTLDQFKSTFNL